MPGSFPPDGRYIVFGAGSEGGFSLWLRALDSEEVRQIPDTEGVELGLAWSPDSRSLVFGLLIS